MLYVQSAIDDLISTGPGGGGKPLKVLVLGHGEGNGPNGKITLIVFCILKVQVRLNIKNNHKVFN